MTRNEFEDKKRANEIDEILAELENVPIEHIVKFDEMWYEEMSKVALLGRRRWGSKRRRDSSRNA